MDVQVMRARIGVSSFRTLALILPLLLAQPGQAAELQTITIPISSTSFATAGVRIAKELGLFEKNGLAAKIVVMDSANGATAALISGAAKVVQSGPGELVAARSRGQPVVAVADLYKGLSASLVLSADAVRRSGVGPAAAVDQRLKALDGVDIASPSATSSYTVAFRLAAEAAGAKIRFTYMAQPAMTAALQAGAIGGMISGAPFWSVPVASGAGVLWISGPRGDLPAQFMPASSVSLQTLESTARTDPAMIKQIRQVVADLGTEIKQHPERVAAAMTKLYPDVDQANLNLALSVEMANWSTRPFTAADMRHEIDFVRASGAPLPDLDSMEPASLLASP